MPHRKKERKTERSIDDHRDMHTYSREMPETCIHRAERCIHPPDL